MSSQSEPERTVSRTLLIALVVVLCLASFMAGIASMWLYTNRTALAENIRTSTNTPTPAATPALTREQGVKLLVDILKILDNEYIDPQALDTGKMFYGAAAGLVAAVGDPHTLFQEPVAASFENQRLEGSFEGIGATLQISGTQFFIAGITAKSPAQKAGLEIGDQILAVDGKPVAGLSLVDLVSLIRGPRGTQVRLTIQHKGASAPQDISVTRDKIEIPTVASRMLDNNIGYVQLSIFNAVATKQLTEAVNALLKQNPVGLVLDLRDNPGGYLETAVEIASIFLPRDTLILTELKRDTSPEEYRVTKSGSATRIPLVVLVNGNSASASEILAGAVQDNKRGLVVGTKSYGKGSVQATHDLINGSSLRVTIAKWNRPNGTNIDGVGITPDSIVEMTQEDVDAGRDPQLDRAVQLLLAGADGQGN
ncbi:MAG: S41 family peptidase [Anaerolineae bacterium]